MNAISQISRHAAITGPDLQRSVDRRRTEAILRVQKAAREFRAAIIAAGTHFTDDAWKWCEDERSSTESRVLEILDGFNDVCMPDGCPYAETMSECQAREFRAAIEGL